jgi:hypothetical protein
MMHWLHLYLGGDSVVQEPHGGLLGICMYWSSPSFKAKSKQKRLNRGKDPKHRYDIDGHARKLQHMVRFHGSSAIYMFVVMRLTLNYMPSGMVL